MSANVPDVPVEILPFLKQRPELSIFGTKTTKPPPPQQPIVYRCDLCTFDTHNQQHYQNHMMEHKSRDCPCPVCGKVYKNETRLQMHMATHETPSGFASLPHICMYCEKRFKTQGLLGSHVKTMHFPSSEVICCHMCNKQLSSKAALKRHIMTIHESYQNFC